MTESEALHEGMEAARMDIQKNGRVLVIAVGDVEVDKLRILPLLLPQVLVHGQYRGGIAILSRREDLRKNLNLMYQCAD